MKAAAGVQRARIFRQDSARGVRGAQPGTKALPVWTAVHPDGPGRCGLLPAIGVWSDVHAGGYKPPLVKAS